MLKVWLALILTCLGAYADVPNPDFEFLFNRLPGIPASRKYQFGTKLREMHNTAICVYDFATSGGAIGNINLVSTDLTTPCLLPGKAVVRNGFIDITTSLASSGPAAVGVSTGKTANDMKLSQIYWNYAVASSQSAVSPVFATVSTYIKLSTANSIVNGVNTNAYRPFITVISAALTAGHMRIFYDYEISE